MKRNKKTGKSNQNQEPVTSNEKANWLLDKMLQIVKKYKELGVVVGAVSVCLWNVICSAYYQGYASGLGVDTHYIQNDSHSLIISILIFAVCLLFTVPLFKMIFHRMDINETGKIIPTLISIGLSILCIFITSLLIIFIGWICKWRTVIELITAPMILLAFFAASIIIYLMQLLLRFGKWLIEKVKPFFKKKKAKKIDKNNKSQEPSPDANNVKVTPHNYCRLFAPRFFCQIVQIECRKATAFQAKFVQYDRKRTSEKTAKAKPLIVRCYLNKSSPKQQIKERSNFWQWFFCVAILLAVAVFAYMIFSYAGATSAINRKEFRFLVEDLNCEISATENNHNTNLILSDTDDYYCLAGYEIEESNGSESITIKSSRQTIIPKSELKDKVYIVQKRFENAQFVTSYVQIVNH